MWKQRSLLFAKTQGDLANFLIIIIKWKIIGGGIKLHKNTRSLSHNFHSLDYLLYNVPIISSKTFLYPLVHPYLRNSVQLPADPRSPEGKKERDIQHSQGPNTTPDQPCQRSSRQCDTEKQKTGWRHRPKQLLSLCIQMKRWMKGRNITLTKWLSKLAKVPRSKPYRSGAPTLFWGEQIKGNHKI